MTMIIPAVVVRTTSTTSRDGPIVGNEVGLCVVGTGTPGVPVGMGLVVGSGEAVGWGDVEGNGVGTGVEVGVLTNVEDMLYSSSTLLKV